MKLISFTNEGRVVAYKVFMGPFVMKMVVLHHVRRGPLLKTKERIGFGGYGSIYVRLLCSKEFVIKVLLLDEKNNTSQQILDAIKEASIYKLCSFLRIGPRVETKIPFDLVCYQDRVQFHLELCEPVASLNSLQEENLIKNMAVLHHYHLVHKDIKPCNTLWSPIYQKVVLTDFGLAAYVEEVAGEKSLTGSEGSVGYMSLAMSKIPKN